MLAMIWIPKGAMILQILYECAVLCVELLGQLLKQTLALIR